MCIMPIDRANANVVRPFRPNKGTEHEERHKPLKINPCSGKSSKTGKYTRTTLTKHVKLKEGSDPRGGGVGWCDGAG